MPGRNPGGRSERDDGSASRPAGVDSVMATLYGDYAKARIGWFFGLTGWQLGVLVVATLPALGAMQAGAWLSFLLLAALWVLVFLLVVVPVKGRSATGWLMAAAWFSAGSLAGWTRFQSRAAVGRAGALEDPDLPGVLAGVQIHEGTPTGPDGARPAIIQHHATRCWAVTAAVVHPGVGMSDAAARQRYGQGLQELLDIAERTELVDEVLFVVRTVPEDGAEREMWMTRHRRAGGPPLARQVNEELADGLTRASVRTETFVTLVVPDGRLRAGARESGGGFEGRSRVLQGLMSEFEVALAGGLGLTSVRWLTSPELAIACRTGFAPGDRAGIVEALDARETDPAVNAEVPWAMAGPSGADPTPRHYSHDAWNSISATLRLPARGGAIGALAPVLTPTEPAERRSLLVSYPILAQTRADRQTANSEWASEVGGHLRARAGVRERAKQRAETRKTHQMDDKLAQGNSMTTPYAVATVTMPKTARISEAGRRLDAAVRRAGFAPLRLDLAQDAGFVASCVPLGTGLTRRGDA